MRPICAPAKVAVGRALPDDANARIGDTSCGLALIDLYFDDSVGDAARLPITHLRAAIGALDTLVKISADRQYRLQDDERRKMILSAVESLNKADVALPEFGKAARSALA
jgi:hypothetical protein